MGGGGFFILCFILYDLGCGWVFIMIGRIVFKFIFVGIIWSLYGVIGYDILII